MDWTLGKGGVKLSLFFIAAYMLSQLHLFAALGSLVLESERVPHPSISSEDGRTIYIALIAEEPPRRR